MLSNDSSSLERPEWLGENYESANFPTVVEALRIELLTSCVSVVKYYDKLPENRSFFSITFQSSCWSGR